MSNQWIFLIFIWLNSIFLIFPWTHMSPSKLFAGQMSQEHKNLIKTVDIGNNLENIFVKDYSLIIF